MKIYAVVHRPEGDIASVYLGMDESTISTMLQDQGFTVDFVDEQTYSAFVEAHEPPPIIVPDLSTEKAVLKDKTAKADDRLDALVKILGL